MVQTNNKGFTLIEVMITLVILSVGILAMSLMQVQAIKGNSSAFSRTNANAIAFTFLEELRRIPFDDANLTSGTNLDAGKAPSGGNPVPTDADHLYNPTNSPTLAGMYQLNDNNIVDNSGKEFQLFWNVTTNSITIGSNTYSPYCTIRLFMYWNTLMGVNSVSFTTIKFNNT
ncbi:MAG: prepilin-type N-terminal cleavage/methylation domain-containing protein [Desulfobacula sp.]|mgnify:FL=1|nr:prepilin-type N-terminal cleavage/methylation domain-containing protein [Desulfobacula sp.]MBT7260864.1 prepilin-type N-terminal cleavage/methylation domain-containing protein [Desulfobacula sp.]